MMSNTIALWVCAIVACMVIVAPAVAATVQCPSTCSCLEPEKAKELGYSAYCDGTKAVCGYDAAKNPMYCYEKPATLPGLFATLKPVVTTTKPTATVTTTAAPQCAGGCLCIRAEDASLKGLVFCSGQQTLCGYDTFQNPLYCYAPPAATAATPATPTTAPAAATTASPSPTATVVAVPSATPSPASTFMPASAPVSFVTRIPIPDAVPCSAGSSCVAERTIREGNHSPSVLKSAPCGYSQAEGTFYCVPSSPDADIPKPVPQNTGIVDAILQFFAEFFGGGPATAPPPATSEMSLDYCKARFGLDSCNGYCVNLSAIDLSSDPVHCGACGNSCSPEQVCVNGTCVYHYGTGECPAAYTCNGACTDVRTDENNCGECGYRCDAGETCCHSSCVDTENDFQNCGDCNNQCPYPQVCREGECMDVGTDENNCGDAGSRCASGRTCCGGACVDPLSDQDNCGACGIRCGFGETCCQGSCIRGSSLQTDENNCGACGHACNAVDPALECDRDDRDRYHVSPSDGRLCCNYIEGDPWGQMNCVVVRPYDCCGGACTDIMSDDDNCGACGNECPLNHHCSMGYCFSTGTVG